VAPSRAAPVDTVSARPSITAIASDSAHRAIGSHGGRRGVTDPVFFQEELVALTIET
jgi:hypothetical protein